MELTLKRLLEQAEFAQAKRGYDRDEVDDFLDRAVAMATKVEAKLTQTMEQAKSAESGGGPSEAEIEAEVARRVEARLAEERAAAPAAPLAAEPAAPAAPAGPSEEERAEEMRRTLVLAQRTADAAIREAREEADKVRATAAADADKSRADLESELNASRDVANERIRQEIAELEGVREALRTDVGVLERHVEEQRNQLRSSVGELQRLLEDPAGFRLAPTPALLDPEVPGYDEGTVEIAADDDPPPAAAVEPPPVVIEAPAARLTQTQTPTRHRKATTPTPTRSTSRRRLRPVVRTRVA